MVRLADAATAVVLGLSATAIAKGCHQLRYTFAGENVGSAVADCHAGCMDAIRAARNNFHDICHAADGWSQDPEVLESSYVRPCTNATNCDLGLPTICRCKTEVLMWRAWKDDQFDLVEDAWWSCDIAKLGNRLALQTPGYLLGRGMFLDAAKVNKGVHCR